MKLNELAPKVKTMELNDLTDEQNELLRCMVRGWRGLEEDPNDELEPALGRAFMPRLPPNYTEEELLAWGDEYNRVIRPKIVAMEVQMVANGELPPGKFVVFHN